MLNTENSQKASRGQQNMNSLHCEFLKKPVYLFYIYLELITMLMTFGNSSET